MASKMAASNSTVPVDKDDVCCPICFGISRNMKLLPGCGHSVCLKCLRKMRTHASRIGFSCPECKRKIQLPSGNVDDLPTNFMIRKIVDSGNFEVDSDDEDEEPEILEPEPPFHSFGRWTSMPSYQNESSNRGGQNGDQTQEQSSGMSTAGVIGTSVLAGALAIGGMLLYKHVRKDK